MCARGNSSERPSVRLDMNKRPLAIAALAATMTLIALGTTAQAQTQQEEPAISARLLVPSKKVVTGSVVQAKLRVVNDTGHDVTVAACPSPFVVALSSKTYVPLVGWLSCAMPFTIPVGTSTYDVPFRAEYSSCGGEGSIPGQGPTLACVNGEPPPLPVGKYQAKLYQSTEVVRPPAPVNVRVVQARR
jgi:hypothetical protein